MKNNVINIEDTKYHVPSSVRYTAGIRKVDGITGYLRLEIIRVIEESAIAFDCDYQELSVGDVLEYLVAREDERSQ